MITNERQYQLASAQIAKLRKAETELELRKRPESEHPTRKKLELDALRGHFQELSSACAEYEGLKNGLIAVPPIKDLAEVPTALIRKRIANGMTQRDLADAIGVAEQQIQRYEANNYASATLERLKEIAEALAVTVDFPQEAPTIERALRNIADRGFDKAFFKRRLVSKTVTTETKGATMPVLDFAARLARVFAWEPSEVFNGDELRLPKLAIAANFKKPLKGNEQKAGLLTAYASFCASAVLAASDLKYEPMPANSQELRDDVLRSFGNLLFTSLAKYAWDHGIAILPIAEPGGFHAAVFRSEDRRAVVVLKQAESHRWTFDLLHEIGHLVCNPHGALRVVDESEVGPTDNEERFASEFAAEVLLTNQAEALLWRAIEKSRKSLPRLKKAVQDVAHDAGVEVSHFALHTAFRLTQEGQPGFWATAQKLSGSVDADAPEVARKILLERLHWNSLDSVDQDILLRAVT